MKDRLTELNHPCKVDPSKNCLEGCLRSAVKPPAWKAGIIGLYAVDVGKYIAALVLPKTDCKRVQIGDVKIK